MYVDFSYLESQKVPTKFFISFDYYNKGAYPSSKIIVYSSGDIYAFVTELGVMYEREIASHSLSFPRDKPRAFE